jgi:hypothetical protein
MIKGVNTDFVFYQKNLNHSYYKNNLLTQINADIDSLKKKSKHYNEYYDKHKSYTSFYNVADSIVNYGDLCENVIYPCLDNLINECNLKSPKQSRVVSIWYNSYEIDSRHSVHCHPNVDISGIYILDLNGEKNNTIFYPNNHNSNFFPVYMTTEDIDEGSLILFPAHLLHEVSPCKKPKVSIGFNIVSNFNLEGE